MVAKIAVPTPRGSGNYSYALFFDKGLAPTVVFTSVDVCKGQILQNRVTLCVQDRAEQCRLKGIPCIKHSVRPARSLPTGTSEILSGVSLLPELQMQHRFCSLGTPIALTGGNEHCQFDNRWHSAANCRQRTPCLLDIGSPGAPATRQADPEGDRGFARTGSGDCPTIEAPRHEH